MNRYEGFEEFVRARGAALSRTAYLLCGDHSAAEELVQDSLVRAAAHWRRIQSANPEGYVRRIMVNQHTSWWRRIGRRERPYADITAVMEGGRDDANVTTERLALVAALSALAPKQRAVIVMRYYEDMPQAEIAEVLGVTTGTVKRNTHDALRRLRTLLPTLDLEPEAGR